MTPSEAEVLRLAEVLVVAWAKKGMHFDRKLASLPLEQVRQLHLAVLRMQLEREP